MENSIYTRFDKCRVNGLTIIRNGFFYPEYILTDGQLCYGKLSGTGAMKRNMILETADGKWLMQYKSWLSCEMQLFNAMNGELVGKATRQKWNNRVNLQLADGFDAVLNKKGIFSWTYYWSDVNYIDLVSIKGNFSFSRPFSVIVDQSAIKTTTNIPLVILTGVQAILVKQSQAAAAAY